MVSHCAMNSGLQMRSQSRTQRTRQRLAMHCVAVHPVGHEVLAPRINRCAGHPLATRRTEVPEPVANREPGLAPSERAQAEISASKIAIALLGEVERAVALGQLSFVRRQRTFG